MANRGRPRKTTTPVKRAASPVTPLRQSKRAKSNTTTPATSERTAKKSIYFDQDSESALSEQESDEDSDGYKDEDASVVSSAQETEESEEDEYNSEDEKPSKRTIVKGRGRPSTGPSVAVSGRGKELWRHGVKADAEPGQQVFVKLPKARPAGNISYKDVTIHPNTLLFLGDLKKNNDREWLKIHDADFRQSQKDFSSFVESMTEKIVEKDETIPELPAKDIIFRIYRDVRFSNDPTPYKTHYSAAWSRTGRKGPYAHYYFHIAPGDCFIGGGIWMPEKVPLSLLRRAMDKKSHKLKNVLLDDGIRKEFLGGIPKDEKKAVKAYLERNAKNALKRRPVGYEEDNPNIGLLRLRNYTLGRKLKDQEIIGPGGLDKLVNLFGTLTPFITYLNSVVMPDIDDNNDEETEDNEDEEDDEEEDNDTDGLID